MPTQQTVLLLGATGRTGGRVLEQLLARAVAVRAIVRSTANSPPRAVSDPGLTVIEASLLSLSDEEIQRLVRGCDAVVSCLGHVLSARGIWGQPRDLVAKATERVCRAIEAVRPAAPVRFILMSSVSVHRPGGLDTRRGMLERALVWLLRGLLPPARDNQRAADFLHQRIGTGNRHVQWVAVRPDALLEGDVTEYALHEGLVSSLSAPASTNMANVAHFMCELATDAKAWERWAGRAPVIVNVASGAAVATGSALGTPKK